LDIRQVHQNLKLEQLPFSAVFEQAPVALSVVAHGSDGELCMLAANRALRTLLGKDDLAEGSLRPWLSDADYERLQAALQSGALPTSIELTLAPAQQQISCQLSCARLDGVDDSAYILTFEDTTDRKEWEQRMMETAGIEQREDFIATLTHDLKTPIVGANMVLTALLDGTLGALSQQQSEIIGKLRTSNHALLKMIHNLLEVYKYESGPESLALEDVDLVDVIKFCAEDVKPLIENKSLFLRLNVPSCKVEAVCDRYAIQRVLVNLLGNAIKFTPTGGEIIVAVDDGEEEVCLKVTDTGSGINPRDQHRLFQRFWQGEPGRRYAAGTGLGLYFCRHVVRAHGGTINCESTPGAGSTFCVQLPKVPPVEGFGEHELA
jgi:signal transduction histidine kinase